GRAGCRFSLDRRNVDRGRRTEPLLVLVGAAGARKQIAAEADPDVDEILPPAAHRDHLGFEPWIVAEDLALDRLWREHAVRLGRTKSLRHADPLVELPRHAKILPGVEARAGPMRAIFVDEERLARHDVAHLADDAVGHPGPFADGAVFRPAIFILRPKPLQ